MSWTDEVAGQQPASTATATPEVCTIVMPIAGMSCAACQSHVERSLRAAPGVVDATVNLMAHSARVIYAPDQSSPDALVKVIDEAGYQATAPSAGAARTSAEEPGHSVGESRRLLWTAIVTIAAGAVLMWISMGAMHAMTRTRSLVLGAVTLLGMMTAGAPVYQRAWRAARHRTTNMHTLVALGTLAAFLYSAAATLWPDAFVRHHLQPDLYYDSVLFILGFLLLGNWMEARAKKRALDAVRTLAELEPGEARILRDGREIVVPTSTVLPDDTVVLRPGERVPVDGIVLRGTTQVDESLLTGEAKPVAKAMGDALTGGSLNYDGSLEYRATAIGAESRLGQILRLVEQAQSSRAPMQQLADRVSRIFVPVILVLATVTFVAWSFFDASRGVAAAIAVLVVACPCAMGLAVPAALTIAVGRGAQLGVLFKGGEALERLAHVDTAVFDKTGTLTEGAPSLSFLRAAAGWTEEQLLQLAASVEQRSEHPLARAVLRAAESRGLVLTPTTDSQARPGMGVIATVGDRRVLAGNQRLLQQHGVAVPEDDARNADQQGATALYIAADDNYAGMLLCRDAVRTEAAAALASMRQLGLRTVLLTGDSPAAAAPVAAELGIDEVDAGLSPEQKLERIRALQQTGARVLMVGDGINDAAAIAQADAGIGMGTGTDLAREAGDAVLLRGDLRAVAATVALARDTRRAMQQNLGWAAIYNVLAVPLAAGAFARFGLLLSPAVAGAAMALSSVSVLLNSLRLRLWRTA